jgi:zinc transport system ATP-binding protein
MATDLDTRHSASAPALQSHAVSFAYHPRATVLDAVSLMVPPASLTCIIGPNGGGKSTFLRLALGLLMPSDGTVSVFGAPPHKACAHVGYVPQQTAVRPDFPISVREVVRMGAFGRETDPDAVERAVQQVGLQGLEDRSFAELSGGQRQRVLIARALVGAPGLLLLDEPSAGVDPAFEQQLRDLLFELKKTVAVVIVSHDLTLIGPQTDQVVLINRTARTLPPEALNLERIAGLYQSLETVS